MNRMSLNLSPIVHPPRTSLSTSLSTALPSSLSTSFSTSLPPIASHDFPEEDPEPTSYYHESDIFEDMPITLVLPGGVTYELIVKTGETVQEIKRKLDANHGIPYSDATLYYNGKCMIDPLSLNDFPGLVCKGGVCLDVKLNPALRVKESSALQYPPQSPPQYNGAQQNGTNNNTTTTNNNSNKNEPPRKNTDYVEVGVAPPTELLAASSLTSISFVEYVDVPVHNNNNISRNNNHSPSLQQPGLYGEALPPSSPPSLPNAFTDSPQQQSHQQAGMNRRKPENETTTTIDVKDDNDPQCKEIQKLGSGSKRWKVCFLF